MKTLLALAALTAVPALTLQAVTTENLNLRSGPTRTSPVMTVLPKGAKVEIGVCSTYCPVVYQGKRGYIARQYLKLPSGNAYTTPLPNQPLNNPGTYTNVDGQRI